MRSHIHELMQIKATRELWKVATSAFRCGVFYNIIKIYSCLCSFANLMPQLLFSVVLLLTCAMLWLPNARMPHKQKRFLRIWLWEQGTSSHVWFCNRTSFCRGPCSESCTRRDELSHCCLEPIFDSYYSSNRYQYIDSFLQTTLLHSWNYLSWYWLKYFYGSVSQPQKEKIQPL